VSESAAVATSTYYWDFFGPNAEQTARHFDEHLRQFLAKNAIAGCETGLESAGAGHFAAFCVAPVEAGQGIERALRPRRKK
jgi:hypothetical protein